MKRYEKALIRKLVLAAALAAILAAAAGCGTKTLPDSSITAASAEAVTVEPETSGTATEAADSAKETDAPTEAVSTEEETQSVEKTDKTEETGKTKRTEPETSPNAGVITMESERLNRFLTGIVQQNIVDTRTDLDEDAELVRFVFGYRRTNEPESVLEEEKDGVSCRILTLEQVNETLTTLFGKTISPDQEDYTIPIDETESFHCVYQDGCFRNMAPYPTEQFTFPIRFALNDKIDEENCTLHFRLYKINPYEWGIGEAERHVSVLPAMSFYDAEHTTNKETKNWIIKIGEGEAVLRDFGDDLQLIEMTGELYHK